MAEDVSDHFASLPEQEHRISNIIHSSLDMLVHSIDHPKRVRNVDAVRVAGAHLVQRIRCLYATGSFSEELSFEQFPLVVEFLHRQHGLYHIEVGQQRIRYLQKALFLMGLPASLMSHTAALLTLCGAYFAARESERYQELIHTLPDVEYSGLDLLENPALVRKVLEDKKDSITEYLGKVPQIAVVSSQ